MVLYFLRSGSTAPLVAVRVAKWLCIDRKTKNSDATDRAAGASGLSRGVRGVTQTKPGRKILKTEAARAR